MSSEPDGFAQTLLLLVVYLFFAEIVSLFGGNTQ